MSDQIKIDGHLVSVLVPELTEHGYCPDAREFGGVAETCPFLHDGCGYEYGAECNLGWHEYSGAQGVFYCMPGPKCPRYKPPESNEKRSKNHYMFMLRRRG